jgi:hypothetical protein
MVMIRTLQVALAAVTLAGAVHAQTPWIDSAGNWHDAPPSYTLACRGPLDLEVGMSASPPITMRFVKATKPATSGVEPGTCAWIDRGVAAAEPDCLQHYASDVSIRISTRANRVAVPAEPARGSVTVEGTIRRSTAAESLEQIVHEQTSEPATPSAVTVSGSSARAPYVRFIATSSEPIAYFRAFAIPGRACLFVERVGP